MAIHPFFTQSPFIEYLLCAGELSRYWEQDKCGIIRHLDPPAFGAHVLGSGFA